MSVIKIPEEAKPCVVVHYAEVGLKGENRGQFENQLRRNIARALSPVGIKSVEREFGRIVVYLPEKFDWTELNARLQNIFGIAHFSLAALVPQDLELITRVAVQMMRQVSFQSFRVTTRRSQKEFPFNSQQISAHVGAAIVESTGAKVNLRQPEATCFIEVFNQLTIIYVNKTAGPGGLPVGVSERAVALLSAGIDSPVAAWKMMKRGVKVVFVHFHSVPATTDASIRNSKKIAEILTRYQYVSKLYAIPILDLQQEIMTKAPAKYRVLLYRRVMFRLAEEVARLEKASALITGESVGQVASQTLSNIRAINEVVTLPVLRPLAGDDKQEIINLAQRIGTFHISTEPFEDCCSLFIPRHPETRADPQKIREAEAQLDMELLYEKALQNADVFKFKYPAAAPPPAK